MTSFQGSFCDRGTVPQSLIDALRERVIQNEQLWYYEDPRFATKHPDSAHIVLRFPLRYPETHEDAEPTVHWPAWEDVVSPLLTLVADRCGMRQPGFAKVMLSRLDAGGTVPTHIDSHPSSQVPHKVHIPVLTNPDVVFMAGGERRHMPAGNAMEINNLIEHGVENLGDTPRVHLIVETYEQEPASTADVP